MDSAISVTSHLILAASPDEARLAGKAERRSRIIEAARDLIREHGEAGFTMSALARRANVSPATPYNLVGPRPRVIEAVVAQEFEAFRNRLVMADAPSGLAGVLEATLLVTDHYGAEPRFYRGLYRAMIAAGGEDLRSQMTINGLDFWTAVVESAHAELEPGVVLRPFILHLLRVVTGVTQAWVIEDWNGERFRAEMRYAALLALAAVAGPRNRADILKQMIAAQDEVERLQALAPA